MKEFDNMTREQQIEALAWEVEHHEQGIGYLQDVLEQEMKRQEWRMKKLTELKDDEFQKRLRLVASISGGVSQ
tara:strand:- start:556 stop:774 length:219 start_codon:yes stop_codon:yes gene_type:complete